MVNIGWLWLFKWLTICASIFFDLSSACFSFWSSVFLAFSLVFRSIAFCFSASSINWTFCWRSLALPGGEADGAGDGAAGGAGLQFTTQENLLKPVARLQFVKYHLSVKILLRSLTSSSRASVSQKYIVCPSVCLCVWFNLSVFFCVSVFLCVSIGVSVYVCVSVSVRPSLYLHVPVCVCLSVSACLCRLSVSVCVPVCVSVILSANLCNNWSMYISVSTYTLRDRAQDRKQRHKQYRIKKQAATYK